MQEAQATKQEKMRGFYLMLAVVLVTVTVASIIAWVRSSSGGTSAATTVRRFTTRICSTQLPTGTYGAPAAVLGIPSAVNQGPNGIAVQFSDDYVLIASASNPGFYIGKLGLFHLSEGKITGYALVDRDIDPCPTTNVPTTIPVPPR